MSVANEKNRRRTQADSMPTLCSQCGRVNGETVSVARSLEKRQNDMMKTHQAFFSVSFQWHSTRTPFKSIELRNDCALEKPPSPIWTMRKNIGQRKCLAFMHCRHQRCHSCTNVAATTTPVVFCDPLHCLQGLDWRYIKNDLPTFLRIVPAGDFLALEGAQTMKTASAWNSCLTDLQSSPAVSA